MNRILKLIKISARNIGQNIIQGKLNFNRSKLNVTIQYRNIRYRNIRYRIFRKKTYIM